MIEPAPFRASEAVAAWLEDLAPYGIFTTDAELVVRSWNRWLTTHSGLAAEAVVGRPLLEAFPELAKRSLDERYRRALQGEISVLSTALHRFLLNLPSPVRRPDGPEMLQTARVAPLTTPGGIVGTITLIEDVTQRESQALILHRQQAHDRLLSEALALLLRSESPMDIAADLFTRISVPLRLDVYLNYLSSSDGLRLHLHSASGIAPETRAVLGTLDVGDERGVAGRLGLRAHVGFPLAISDRALGTLFFGSYERETLANDEVELLGKLSQYVAIALDRAQRDRILREAQDRLREHAEELEQRVAERTAKLNETITQLESFSYTVAHDLRAPIRSLTGFTEILLSDHTRTLTDSGKELVTRLHRASNRLDALTRDLLKFSRITRQDVKLGTVDLRELVEDIVSVTPALQTGALTVLPTLGAVKAQRTLLQQCLSNLLDNAIKFARPGVPPAIFLRTETYAADRRRRIWVEDNGVGIPAAAHEKVFGIFERIPGPVQVDGTGIGLAIVARSCTQMGGTCGVESVLGEGSRFWLEFPLPDEASA